MNSFKTFQQLYILLVFGFVLSLGACKDDKNDDPTLSLVASESVSAVRANTVTINLTGMAESGATSLTATPTRESAEDISIAANAEDIQTIYTYTIPAEARLSDTYSISFELTDATDRKTTASTTISVEPLLASTPSTYAFERNGNSTVSYSGQNERLDMVKAMKTYLGQGDKKELTISAAVLNDAYANTGDNGNGFFDFTSTKQLKNKTFAPDLDNNFMENLFAEAEAVSQSGADASNGVAGFIERENSGNTIMVDANGREFTQLIEKGLMGTVMYNQIYNTYFSDDRTGDDVENTALREGKNYTDMEHHWDEAFGYFNPPLDFASNWPEAREGEDRYWSHYSNVVDPFINSNDDIMEAFLAGRTAIVNNDLNGKNAQRTILFEKLELVAAATSIHYINQSLGYINEGKIGEAFHTLSEAWAFVNALTYSPNRRISLDQIATIKENDLGANGNSWNVTAADLNRAKTTLVSIFTELESVKNQL